MPTRPCAGSERITFRSLSWRRCAVGVAPRASSRKFRRPGCSIYRYTPSATSTVVGSSVTARSAGERFDTPNRSATDAYRASIRSDWKPRRHRPTLSKSLSRSHPLIEVRHVEKARPISASLNFSMASWVQHFLRCLRALWADSSSRSMHSQIWSSDRSWNELGRGCGTGTVLPQSSQVTWQNAAPRCREPPRLSRRLQTLRG